MIKNEKQHKITKNQLKRLQALLRDKEISEDRNETDILKTAEKNALLSQITDLKTEIQEYEDLRSGKFLFSHLDSLEDLPITLIRARIALGLTQKELGNLLNLKEQQIQLYEATDYKTAKLSRILEVMQALDIQQKMRVSVASSEISIKYILKKFKDIGIDYEFLSTRLIPSHLSRQFEEDHDKNLTASSPAILQISSILGKIFGWKLTDIIGEGPLKMNLSVAGSPNFKKRKKSEKKKFDVYVVYAHYLALIILEATKGRSPKKVSIDPEKVRQEILKEHGELSFKNVLNYIWNLGIPVLPLKDSGAFHGACWRINGRNIIVLKQKTLSPARWLFDLLHELWHVAQNPKEKQLSVIEPGTNDAEYYESNEEIEANQFAGDVILNGRAEEITELCVKEANGKIEWLKKAVIEVSQRENVPTDSLAYYIAFRLSHQNINWWGTAENLQNSSNMEQPWVTARNFILKKGIFDRLNEMDKNLLMQALLE